jgi:predicted metalloprotease with PDZ domain
MRKTNAFWVALLAVALVFPTLAGNENAGAKKCPLTAQECLDPMATRVKNTGWIGVELDVAEDEPGHTVRNVVPGSPAAKAGLQAGDVLWTFEGTLLSPENEVVLEKLRRERMKVGSTVTYVVRRGGAGIPVKITRCRERWGKLAPRTGPKLRWV